MALELRAVAREQRGRLERMVEAPEALEGHIREALGRAELPARACILERAVPVVRILVEAEAVVLLLPWTLYLMAGTGGTGGMPPSELLALLEPDMVAAEVAEAAERQAGMPEAPEVPQAPAS